jgi:signal transduction histidine kinase
VANKVANSLGPMDLLDRTAGTGAYTMAACSPYGTAWFEDGPKRNAQTYFTKYLADLVESGIPDAAPALRLRAIFDQLREMLGRDRRPVPEDRSIDSAGDFLFAHNAAPLPADANDSSTATVPAAELLKNQNAMIVSLGRRNQALLTRQLQLLESLEDAAQDADQLSALFRLDHLATRMRRNSENFLLLAGYEAASRRWSQPVPLTDVLRAAASEIEQYERVMLNVQPGVQVIGQAVNDMVHLVAEIMENATTFSPEDTQVYVTAQILNTGGMLLDVTDNGVGIAEQDMAHANWRLDNPPAVDAAVSRRMGLFVVGRLAARHGIRVRLRHADSGGVTALIWLPDSLITTGAGP